LEDRDRVVADRPEQLNGAVEVPADELRRVRIRGQRDWHPTFPARGQEIGMRVQLPHGFPQTRGGYLDRHTRFGNRVRHRSVVELRTLAEDLQEVGMRERIEQAAARRRLEPLEISSPGLLDADRIEEPRLGIDPETVDVMHRPEEEIPRVRSEQLARLLLTTGHVVA